MGQQFQHGISHQSIDVLTGALWLAVLKDFSAHLNISFAGLALYFVEVIVTLHFTLREHSSLDSQETHLQKIWCMFDLVPERLQLIWLLSLFVF